MPGSGPVAIKPYKLTAPPERPFELWLAFAAASIVPLDEGVLLGATTVVRVSITFLGVDEAEDELEPLLGLVEELEVDDVEGTEDGACEVECVEDVEEESVDVSSSEVVAALLACSVFLSVDEVD